ncbi:glycosyltransferase 87 family protein [Nocardia takedensis]
MWRLSWVARVWAVWVLTRVVMVVFTGVTALPHSVWDASAADLGLYHQWADLLVNRQVFPSTDERWQYPPGAGGLIALPWLLGDGHAYSWWFFALVAAADAGALVLLLRAAARDGSIAARTGPWVWVLGVALLGRVCYGRFDLIVAALAVAALVWAARRPIATGVVVAAGVLLKLWPAVVLLGLRGRSLWVTSAAAVLAGAVASVGVTALAPGGWSFLRFQSERGVQIESLAATPLLIARLFGADYTIAHRYGAEEVLGPGVAALAGACVVATVLLGAGLVYLWWRIRPAAPDLVLVAVLVALVTSRVLSPQYVVWAVAVAAVCALDPRSAQRPLLPVILLVAFASQVEFPFVYDRVATGTLPGVLVLTVRNALLLAATAWSVLLLWRGRSNSADVANSAPTHACGDDSSPEVSTMSAITRTLAHRP